MHEDDVRLVRRLLARDERAFDEFFRSYFPRLYRFARVRLRDDESAAEEIVQAALCKAVDKLSTYRGDAALFSWLCTFCRHEMSAHFSRATRGGPHVDLEVATAEIQAALVAGGADRGGPERALEREDLARQVHATLDSLPGHYGDVLEWKYVHDLSVKEIGLRLGVGAKAAESLMTRARVAFREAFAGLQRKKPAGSS